MVLAVGSFLAYLLRLPVARCDRIGMGRCASAVLERRGNRWENGEKGTARPSLVRAACVGGSAGRRGYRLCLSFGSWGRWRSSSTTGCWCWSSQQRALLVILLLHRGEMVSTDRLSDEVWGERPPASAAKTVQAYISNLRRALGDGVLVTRGHGYLLQTARGQVDVDRFEALVDAGRRRFGRSAPGERPAAGGVGGVARTAVGGLRVRAVRASRGCPAGGGALGGDRGAHRGGARSRPARSRSSRSSRRWCASAPRAPPGQLMLAVYRSGRQAEALEVYREGRRVLDELGIEPGTTELQELGGDPSGPRLARAVRALSRAAPSRRCCCWRSAG